MTYDLFSYKESLCFNFLTSLISGSLVSIQGP
nr:MAG TPA: hypothetical protein [Caudoviricetes sp.]